MLALSHAADYLACARDAAERARRVQGPQGAELTHMAATWTRLSLAALEQAGSEAALASPGRDRRPAEASSTTA